MGQQTEFKTLTHAGRSWKVGPYTYEVHYQFQHFLECRAVDDVRRKRHLFSPAEYEKALAAVVQANACFAFEYRSPAWFQAVNTAGGQREVLRLCLLDAQPETTAEEADELYDATPEAERSAVLDWAIAGPFAMRRPGRSSASGTPAGSSATSPST